ncbi:MAG: amidase [Chitinophagaceae bacterium]
MDRRNFLRNTSAAAASALISADAFADAKDFELNEVTVDALQEQMRLGKMTSKQLTQKYLDRIKAVDKSGPMLNAVIEVNPDALAIAAQMDAERKAGKLRGPLHGIPVLIKDNINTGDKMMTTAGALALEGNRADKDAFIIARLREAGAVLLGKTNLSEWANFRSSRSTSGWSSRGGQTRNPFALNRNPSGSSSGSGAAVSANLCAIAIGTETNGSIISPASSCGVVGLKPTVGLWSRQGIIPISATQDTAGPMTRTVKDAAYLLGACTGVDGNDGVTAASQGKAQKDYAMYCKTDALKGKRIGIEKAYFTGHEGVVALYKQAIEILKGQGAEVVEVELLKLTRPLGQPSFVVLQYEFKDGVNAYLRTANAKVKTLAEVIAFNKANEAKAMPYFKQETLELCESKKGLQETEYVEALKKSIGARQIIDELMKTNNLHAICSTSSGFPTCIDQVNGDYGSGFSFSSPAALAGYPHITVPMGHYMGLPAGFSFMASAWQEAEVIGMAYAYEQASRKRTAPEFRASV